jgi:enoyl-CoA hydratase
VYKNIILEKNPPAAVVTINRPDKMNALNNQTLSEIAQAFDELRSLKQIKGVVVTGAGEKAFVAGADISEIAVLDEKSALEFAQNGQEIFLQIEQFPKPVLAAVNGFALGGGCELALACHFRICSENARFGQPEVNLGIIPGFGGTQRLSRAIGKGYAMEMCVTGQMVAAQEALRINLVNHVYPLAELLPQAKEIIKMISEKSAHAVRQVIDSVNRGLDENLVTGLNIEAKNFSYCCGHGDKTEGTSAFLEKRKPRFSE